ncbi:MAG TPA: PilZ domain-containing protein [Pyrinomonadaceae bacterium]|nr:PilZ domain-containing protein [Pyrinomonadaceae bacterium]
MRLALPVRVSGRDGPDREWTEMTRLVDVSPFGARFRISRPTEPGRLLFLVLNMPRQLRAFDHAEDQYRVWSMVRNVRMLDPAKEKGALIEVGVAFIGKRPPKSYESNPTQRYEIAQTKLESGLWETADYAEQLSRVVQDDDDKRKESRQLIPVEVLIEVFSEGKLVKSENTVTENISRRGAAVFTALDLPAGTFVKLSSARYNTSVLGVVRGIRTGAEGIKRLHLEFLGSEWPL